MKQPEIKTWNRVVVARIAHVKKPEQLLINKVKPQEAVILSRSAAHREIEIWWIPQRRHDVPWRSDGEHDQQAAQRMKQLPDFPVKQLPRQGKIEQRRTNRKHYTNQALEQQAGS